MSITVNTNMSSIIAQRSLYKATNKMNTALERLSTGLRINSSKDDAAGSAISTKLEYKMSSYDVAKDNAQMGQSMLDTANGTLSNINSMLQRMRDLSEQAANGTYGEDERKTMQAEIDGLTEEIYRIKNTTEFNGKKILGEEEASIKRVSEAEAIAQGYTVVKTAKELYSAFHNADGTQKLNAKVMLFADIDLNELGDLDGNGSNWEAIGIQNKAFGGEINGNGYTIFNLKLNNENSSNLAFIGASFHANIKNLNMVNSTVKGNSKVGSLVGFCLNSIIDNVKSTNANISGQNRDVGGLFGCILGGNINNCLSNAKVSGFGAIGGFAGYYFNGGEVNNCSSSGNAEAKGDSVGGFIGAIEKNATVKNCSTEALIKTVPNAPGSFLGKIIGSGNTLENNNCKYDVDVDGNTVKLVGKGDIGETNVKLSPNLDLSKNQNISILTNLQVGISSSNASVISVDTGFSLGDTNVSVLSEFSARNSLDKIDSLMSKIIDKLTNIGATQNRLESVMEFQEIQRNALTSANSLIKDADIAKESANYVKNQILQNVTSTLLATANQNPSIALQLI